MADENDYCVSDDTHAALVGVSAVFGSIGRILICVDEAFHVVHA